MGLACQGKASSLLSRTMSHSNRRCGVEKLELEARGRARAYCRCQPWRHPHHCPQSSWAGCRLPSGKGFLFFAYLEHRFDSNPCFELRPVASLPGHRQLGLEPPALVSFSSGLRLGTTIGLSSADCQAELSLCLRLAGVAVDVPLHPLDTLKTRMQSTDGMLGQVGPETRFRICSRSA